MLRNVLILLKITEKELNYKTKENREKMLEDKYIFNLVWKAVTRTNFKQDIQ